MSILVYRTQEVDPSEDQQIMHKGNELRKIAMEQHSSSEADLKMYIDTSNYMHPHQKGLWILRYKELQPRLQSHSMHQI